MPTLATTIPKTSWAFTAHLFIKEMPSADTVLGLNDFIFTDDTSKLAADTYDLGYIAEDGFTITTNEGETLEARDINGEVLDRLMKEGNIQIGFNLIKPSEATRGKFWEIVSAGDDGTADHLRVKSILNATHYALAFGNVGPDAVGTEGVIFPYCSVSANPTYAANTGWGMECTASALKGGAVSKSDKFLLDFVTLDSTLLGLGSGSGNGD